MQKIFSEKNTCWLLPVVLILFILEVAALPLALGITYSGRSESPDHILTYTQGRLTWDSATGVNANGVAELDLFDAIYNAVESQDESNVVAPGTAGTNIVRLKNSVSDSVKYTAVLYCIRTSDELPVKVVLNGEGFSDTDVYQLPKSIADNRVIRAVTGKAEGGEIQDFDISWLWNFYESDRQDVFDTRLGNKVDPDEVTVGLYIVVEDNNSYISTPEVPKTDDNSRIGMYFALMLISLIMLILLLIERRKEECVSDQDSQDDH